MKQIRISCVAALAAIVCAAGAGFAATPDSSSSPRKGSETAPAAVTKMTASGMKQLVFEEQRIEGKIRRPQLVLIKADQRPEFNPMVMQSLGKTRNIAGLIDQSLLEETQYEGAFKFDGTKIVNIVP
ncbi:MAG: hypothetical protein JW768_06950 [Chitinispirillaceae bacterium]|nr:hypothetical protein [Chitinispirillaceae bacterium]